MYNIFCCPDASFVVGGKKKRKDDAKKKKKKRSSFLYRLFVCAGRKYGNKQGHGDKTYLSFLSLMLGGGNKSNPFYKEKQKQKRQCQG